MKCCVRGYLLVEGGGGGQEGRGDRERAKERERESVWCVDVKLVGGFRGMLWSDCPVLQL